MIHINCSASRFPFLVLLALFAGVLSLSGCSRSLQKLPEGVQVELKAKSGSLPFDPGKRNSVMKEVEETLQKRVMGLQGVVSPRVERKGADGVVVTLPGYMDARKAAGLLTASGSLDFYWLKDVQGDRNKTAKWQMTPSVNVGDAYVFTSKSGEKIDSKASPDKVMKKVVNAYDPVKNPGGNKPVLTGKDLMPNAISDLVQTAGAVIRIQFTRDGTRIFREFTRSHVGECLAIFFDGSLLTAPRINEAIPGGEAQISGFKSISEAQAVADMLNAGPLPVPLDVVNTRKVPAHNPL